LPENIDNLVKLQSVDTQLDEIKKLRGDLPRKVDQFKTEIEDLKEEIDDDQNSIRDFKKEASELELEEKDYKEKLKKYQDQLYKATSNKEYEATTAQIEYCEEEIDRLRSRSDEVELKVMELEEASGPKSEHLEELNEELKTLESELDSKIQETSREESLLNKQRELLQNEVRKNVLNRYERIRNAKDGLAVAPIVKNACGGCFNQIPPQLVIEVREKRVLKTCEFCGRIIYFDNNNSGS